MKRWHGIGAMALLPLSVLTACGGGSDADSAEPVVAPAPTSRTMAAPARVAVAAVEDEVVVRRGHLHLLTRRNPVCGGQRTPARPGRS